MKLLADAVRLRARQRCEYCLLPQGAFQRLFEIEHILARQHGGAASFDNLALACGQCNLKKGPNLAGIDPSTGLLTRLFSPRTDSWIDHFSVSNTRSIGLEINGTTSIGRTTEYVLGMNEAVRPMLRLRLNREPQYRWPGV